MHRPPNVGYRRGCPPPATNGFVPSMHFYSVPAVASRDGSTRVLNPASEQRRLLWGRFESAPLMAGAVALAHHRVHSLRSRKAPPPNPPPTTTPNPPPTPSTPPHPPARPSQTNNSIPMVRTVPHGEEASRLTASVEGRQQPWGLRGVQTPGC